LKNQDITKNIFLATNSEQKNRKRKIYQYIYILFLSISDLRCVKYLYIRLS